MYSTPCEALIFLFIVSCMYCILPFPTCISHRHFLSSVFHQERGFFLVLLNHIISTEGPLSLKHTSFFGLFQKRSIPPRRKLAIPPSPSPDILYKFKAFFRQSQPPSPDDGNFLCGWGMDLFWNDPLEWLRLACTNLTV